MNELLKGSYVNNQSVWFVTGKEYIFLERNIQVVLGRSREILYVLGVRVFKELVYMMFRDWHVENPADQQVGIQIS